MEFLGSTSAGLTGRKKIPGVYILQCFLLLNIYNNYIFFDNIKSYATLHVYMKTIIEHLFIFFFISMQIFASSKLCINIVLKTTIGLCQKSTRRQRELLLPKTLLRVLCENTLCISITFTQIPLCLWILSFMNDLMLHIRSFFIYYFSLIHFRYYKEKAEHRGSIQNPSFPEQIERERKK